MIAAVYAIYLIGIIIACFIAMKSYNDNKKIKKRWFEWMQEGWKENNRRSTHERL